MERFEVAIRQSSKSAINNRLDKSETVSDL